MVLWHLFLPLQGPHTGPPPATQRRPWDSLAPLRSEAGLLRLAFGWLAFKLSLGSRLDFGWLVLGFGLIWLDFGWIRRGCRTFVCFYYDLLLF